MNVKVKQRIPLKIKKMGINGEGIGFYKKTLVFVPGALKGEEVYCQVTKVQRNFIEAKLLTINKRSKFRVDRLVRFMIAVGAVKSCTSTMTSSWSLRKICCVRP